MTLVQSVTPKRVDFKLHGHSVGMIACVKEMSVCVVCQDPRVLDAMLPYQLTQFGNPHSRTHAYGWESEAAVETAREVRHGVYFTSDFVFETWFCCIQ